MIYSEIELTEENIAQLISMSSDWEKEKCTYGYCKNSIRDIEGNRVFAAVENGRIAAYLFGSIKNCEKSGWIIPEKTAYFETEELYVRPEYRSRGIGKKLFKLMENKVQKENVKYLFLNTATNDYKKILHFYVEEADMKFWSAALFKELN